MTTAQLSRKTRRWPQLSRGRFAGLPRLRVFLVRHRHDLPGFRCGCYIARNAAAGAVARDLVVWVQHRDSGAHHQYGVEFPLSRRRGIKTWSEDIALGSRLAESLVHDTPSTRGRQ